MSKDLVDGLVKIKNSLQKSVYLKEAIQKSVAEVLTLNSQATDASLLFYEDVATRMASAAYKLNYVGDTVEVVVNGTKSVVSNPRVFGALIAPLAEEGIHTTIIVTGPDQLTFSLVRNITMKEAHTKVDIPITEDTSSAEVKYMNDKEQEKQQRKDILEKEGKTYLDYLLEHEAKVASRIGLLKDVDGDYVTLDQKAKLAVAITEAYPEGKSPNSVNMLLVKLTKALREQDWLRDNLARVDANEQFNTFEEAVGNVEDEEWSQRAFSFMQDYYGQNWKSVLPTILEAQRNEEAKKEAHNQMNIAQKEIEKKREEINLQYAKDITQNSKASVFWALLKEHNPSVVDAYPLGVKDLSTWESIAEVISQNNKSLVRDVASSFLDDVKKARKDAQLILNTDELLINGASSDYLLSISLLDRYEEKSRKIVEDFEVIFAVFPPATTKDTPECVILRNAFLTTGTDKYPSKIRANIYTDFGLSYFQSTFNNVITSIRATMNPQAKILLNKQGNLLFKAIECSTNINARCEQHKKDFHEFRVKYLNFKGPYESGIRLFDVLSQYQKAETMAVTLLAGPAAEVERCQKAYNVADDLRKYSYEVITGAHLYFDKKSLSDFAKRHQYNIAAASHTHCASLEVALAKSEIIQKENNRAGEDNPILNMYKDLLVDAIKRSNVIIAKVQEAILEVSFADVEDCLVELLKNDTKHFSLIMECEEFLLDVYGTIPDRLVRKFKKASYPSREEDLDHIADVDDIEGDGSPFKKEERKRNEREVSLAYFKEYLVSGNYRDNESEYFIDGDGEVFKADTENGAFYKAPLVHMGTYYEDSHCRKIIPSDDNKVSPKEIVINDSDLVTVLPDNLALAVHNQDDPTEPPIADIEKNVELLNYLLQDENSRKTKSAERKKSIMESTNKRVPKVTTSPYNYFDKEDNTAAYIDRKGHMCIGGVYKGKVISIQEVYNDNNVEAVHVIDPKDNYRCMISPFNLYASKLLKLRNVEFVIENNKINKEATRANFDKEAEKIEQRNNDYRTTYKDCHDYVPNNRTKGTDDLLKFVDFTEGSVLVDKNNDAYFSTDNGSFVYQGIIDGYYTRDGQVYEVCVIDSEGDTNHVEFSKSKVIQFFDDVEFAKVDNTLDFSKTVQLYTSQVHVINDIEDAAIRSAARNFVLLLKKAVDTTSTSLNSPVVGKLSALMEGEYGKAMTSLFMGCVIPYISNPAWLLKIPGISQLVKDEQSAKRLVENIATELRVEGMAVAQDELLSTLGAPLAMMLQSYVSDLVLKGDSGLVAPSPSPELLQGASSVASKEHDNERDTVHLGVAS
jgi:hypothetical protein